MTPADSSPLYVLGASFMTASWMRCPMTPADSTLHHLVGASFMAA
eukprot:CAMPEP_0201959084 /NCGR_PEP_ID=MMETSP0904-20121228/6133_1 /ASSEMBLY_ACC=CAM_ASM_000553 /TAXON_ID=420261 /ORGANISM="Thalassiosira antarctica, Strain CCMP982" /LENGTH=44 /DNA_ID= /DNA_START= /DNA_END= /DNA_ORIENTATION=